MLVVAEWCILYWSVYDVCCMLYVLCAVYASCNVLSTFFRDSAEKGLQFRGIQHAVAASDLVKQVVDKILGRQDGLWYRKQSGQSSE